MTPQFLTACEVFKPAEKACWEILFRERADTAAIPAPALDDAMERTLAQLWSLLSAHSVEKWMKTMPPEPRPPWLRAGCGLEELLAFFASGERALELTLVEIERDFPRTTAAGKSQHQIELQLAFNVLVQRGLDALCGDCAELERCTLSGKRRPLSKAMRGGPKPRQRASRLPADKRKPRAARGVTAPVLPLSTRQVFHRRGARADRNPDSR